MIALAWPFVALVGIAAASALLWRASGNARASAELTGQMGIIRSQVADYAEVASTEQDALDKRMTKAEEQLAAMKFDVRALENRE